MLKEKSLRTQLMVIVVLALLPLAIASIAQGVLHVRARQAAIDDVLRQTATYATHNEQNIFIATQSMLTKLAPLPELRAGQAACHHALDIAMFAPRSILNVSFIGADGKPVCSSTGAYDTTDYSALPFWNDLRSRKTLAVGSQMHSHALNEDVLPVLLPLHDAAGNFTGALAAALDLKRVSQTNPYGRLPPYALMLIVDQKGEVIAANREMPEGLGAEIARVGRDHAQHTYLANSGNRWRWTAERIGGTEKLIAFAMTEPLPFSVTRAFLLGNILLPILMVILASIAMWLGTQRYVIRWTTYLRRVSAAYAQNHFNLELTELEEAPDEFKLLGYEMKHMATSIRDRDRRLTAALDQKSAMAREIHHRIKNNLQIVSSLISLYSQNVADEEGKLAFSQIAARVGALTLIQRRMEMNETQPILDMRRLVSELADQMRTIAAESNVRYRLLTDVQEWYLPPDMATPVIFFAVEALVFELFVPQQAEFVRNVVLTFAADGEDHLLLSIEDGVFASAALRKGRPPPERIFAALAEQLKARYWLEKSPEGKSRLMLRLPLESGTQGPAIRRPAAVESEDQALAETHASGVATN